MDTHKTKRPHWKAGEIIASKPLTSLLLTAVLFLVIAFKAVEPAATVLAKQLGIVTGSREESIYVISGLAGSFLVAAVLAVLLLKLACNLILACMDSEKAAAHHAKASRPKWNIVYSVIFGYILLLVLIQLAKIADPLLSAHASKEGASAITHSFLILLVCGILPFALAFLSVKAVNRLMVRLTRTNQELIEEIRAGLHDDKLPPSLRNEEDIECIIQILNAAMASTVRGAAAVYMVKRALVKLYRSLGKCGGLLAIPVGLVTMGSLGVMDAVGWKIYNALSASDGKDGDPAKERIAAGLGAPPARPGRERENTAAIEERNAWLKNRR